EIIEPRDEIEELVAQVWREVLKLDRLGAQENVFQLGGHSLRATRREARLRGHCNVDLALRKIFERLTVAGLAEEIAILRRNQSGTGVMPIMRIARGGKLPLSFSQRRLWFLQKLDGNLAGYHIPALFRIDGAVDGTALAQALNLVTARHEALRTAIREVGGEPCQEIVAQLTIALPVTDLSSLPNDQAESEWRRLATLVHLTAYDLARAPLWRAHLVKLAEQEHLLILNFHHLIADGASLAIFYRELASSYEAHRRKKIASFAPLPLSYADYAGWQQQWLASPACAAELDYWKRNLAGLAAPASMPTDFPRPAERSYRGARSIRRLPVELSAALNRFTRQQGVTSFMTLLAAFSVLLARIGGQTDVVIGSTVAGRNHAAMEGVIGFFINVLPLRLQLGDNPTFIGLLRRVREVCLDAYSNQELPFEKLIEEVNPARAPSRNPLFDILFNVADLSERKFSLAGCKIDKIMASAPSAKFDLVLSAPEIAGSVELTVDYNVELYRAERIGAVLEQFELILAQALRCPELAIEELSLVGETARGLLPDPTALLDDRWEGAIHELVAEQARHAPAKTALVQGGESWSYAELDQAAARLSRALRAGGVMPKDVVAIYAARDASLVVALLGILQTGASFLILDPAYPAARTIDYLKIARPRGWIELGGRGVLSLELDDCLKALKLKVRISLPGGKAAIAAALTHSENGRIPVPVAANDPAYIAFTSGSSGEPKGVLCGHGPMTHFLPWQRDAFELRASDRFAMLSGLAYSHLHRDQFTALALGATLYIPDDRTARAPDLLANWLDDNRITVLHLTPALGQLLLAGGHCSLPAVRRILFGGDVLTGEEVRRMHRLAPKAVIGSFYGATESQRAVGYYEIGGEMLDVADHSSRPVPLGRGIKDVQLLVLNKRRQLCGIGELGELYVRSPHLALGYVDDDQRSGEMFIVNPFTGNGRDRLYRTGELGRYRHDGNVDWAGRSDRRVNIRGFRVELAEVETALKQHPTVLDAVVIARDFPTPESDNPKPRSQNRKFDKRLVAYVVASEEGESEIDVLRSYLAARVPDYLVPGYFVLLDRLPLGPNGKLDHHALPPVMQACAESSTAALAPRSEVEAKLCEIFSEVLGRERIGVEDNFFRLGGHSLLAAQVALRIKNIFGIGLDLRAFLAAPTLAALARTLGNLTVNPVPAGGGEREEIEL
ncbi:MAG: amino acid adenylation domain-containing protein, partial [Candidatus Binatia bacterium]